MSPQAMRSLRKMPRYCRSSVPTLVRIASSRSARGGPVGGLLIGRAEHVGVAADPADEAADRLDLGALPEFERDERLHAGNGRRRLVGAMAGIEGGGQTQREHRRRVLAGIAGVAQRLAAERDELHAIGRVAVPGDLREFAQRVHQARERVAPRDAHQLRLAEQRGDDPRRAGRDGAIGQHVDQRDSVEELAAVRSLEHRAQRLERTRGGEEILLGDMPDSLAGHLELGVFLEPAAGARVLEQAGHLALRDLELDGDVTLKRANASQLRGGRDEGGTIDGRFHWQRRPPFSFIMIRTPVSGPAPR